MIGEAGGEVNVVQARDHAVQGNTTNAVSKLNAFINQVNAKRGSALTNAQADALIASANAITAMIQAPITEDTKENL